MTLGGHTNAVGLLACDPNLSYQVASGSHHGTGRILDIRPARADGTEKVGEAVYTMEKECAKGKLRRVAGDGLKVLGVVWNGEGGIASAGEAKMVQPNKGG